MDNLTHSLVGLAASKAGLEKLSPGTTTLCLLAANAPDSDILALIFGGRWAFLQHHRGITHSIVGTMALALALPVIFYLGDYLIAGIRKRARSIRLPGLLFASVLVSATHPFLDWTNNYGIRFLLPWNSRWFYGDSVFIVDPFLWLILGGAAFLVTAKSRKLILVWLAIALVPTYLAFFVSGSQAGSATVVLLRMIWIMALVALVVLFRRQIGKRWGAKVPVSALIVATVYVAGLFVIHSVAIGRARTEATNIAGEKAEYTIEVAAMPTLANPFRWVCVMETESAAYRFDLALIGGIDAHPKVVRYEKPEPENSPAIVQTLHDRRTQIFLGFARFPVVRVLGEDCATQTLVQFADLRYTEPGQNRGTFALELPVDCPTAGQKVR